MSALRRNTDRMKQYQPPHGGALGTRGLCTTQLLFEKLIPGKDLNPGPLSVALPFVLSHHIMISIIANIVMLFTHNYPHLWVQTKLISF